jgi:cytochrome c
MKFMLSILSIFLISACDGNQGKRDTNSFHLPPEGFIGDYTSGAALYRENCLLCHGRAGNGSRQGPPLVLKTYNSTHHADLAFHLAVKMGVRRHHWRFGDMPPLPDVTPQDVGHIIVYVRGLQRRAGIK